MLRYFSAPTPDMCRWEGRFRGYPRTTGTTLTSVLSRLRDRQGHRPGMEALGYDIPWLAEHHLKREGYECIPTSSCSVSGWPSTPPG